ncbi:MAG: GlxA family transcriptional regulator [Pseudomonadota bacterium]
MPSPPSRIPSAAPHLRGGGADRSDPDAEELEGALAQMPAPERAERRRLAFLLLNDFSMIALTAAIEPLRSANRLAGRQSYDWSLVGESGAPVRASSGLAIAVDLGIAELAQRVEDFDVFFVVTGLLRDPQNEGRLHGVLRRAARAGRVVGSISAGAFVLARAGLLDGYRCTVHWEYQPAFEDAFPEIECTAGLYVIDRNRWTGSGGISSMDMMLEIIAADHGPRLAREVGNNVQGDRIRNASIRQRPGALARLDTLPAPVQRAVTLMLANIETPLKMSAIATATGLNLRRMERLFQSHLGDSPAQFYRSLRLERARELLMHTNLSALETAMLTGFSSSSHFALAYQKQHGIRPSETRRQAEAANNKSTEGD